jgi:quinol monooxygenase YgiN
MYGVIGQVKIDPARGDEAEKLLHEQVIPMVKQHPGFVTAYWFRSDDGASGHSVMIFESEAAARKVAENIPPAAGDAPVTPVRFEAMRIVGQA